MNKSERLRVNQDNILTTDEKLVYVACPDPTVRRGVFLLMNLWIVRLRWHFLCVPFASNSFWQLQLCCPAISFHIIGQSGAAFGCSFGIFGLMLADCFLGSVLLHWLAASRQFLEIQLLKQLEKMQVTLVFVFTVVQITHSNSMFGSYLTICQQMLFNKCHFYD